MIQQSLILTGKRKAEWQYSEVAELKADEVLIKTIATAVSIGAQLPQYTGSDWSDPKPVYPRKMGYESFGEIIKAGSGVTSLKVGDKVIAFYGHRNLGIVSALQAFPVPEHIGPKTALLAILSCDAAKGVRKLGAAAQDKVVISGMGTMGLLALHYLKTYFGVKKVDVIEPERGRRGLARQFGADTVYLPDAHPYAVYDGAVECSARNQGFAALQGAVKQDGQICILSDGNREPFTLQPDFFEKELQIVGSSDGRDYRKHAEWFYGMAAETPYIEGIFDYEIESQQLIGCLEALADRTINPIKIAVLFPAG